MNSFPLFTITSFTCLSAPLIPLLPFQNSKKKETAATPLATMLWY